MVRSGAPMIFNVAMSRVFSNVMVKMTIAMTTVDTDKRMIRNSRICCRERSTTLLARTSSCSSVGIARSRLGEREVVGEMSLLDPAPRSATVVAETEARLLKIQRADFDEILDLRPEIARAVIQVLVRRLREANAR